MMSSVSDRKMRFAGLLEHPQVSRWQRHILDFGRWQGVARVLAGLKTPAILEVGCGLGEICRACASGYVGIDNSMPRVRYAGRRYVDARFLVGDGLALPFKPRAFDMVMLLDTAHHLADDQLVRVLGQMCAVSRDWVLVSDALLFAGQPGLSRFVYSLDRGAAHRDDGRLRALLAACAGLRLERVAYFTTFPGLYRRGVFLLKVVRRG